MVLAAASVAAAFPAAEAVSPAAAAPAGSDRVPCASGTRNLHKKMAGKTAIYYCDSTGCFVIMEMMKPICSLRGTAAYIPIKSIKPCGCSACVIYKKRRNKCGGFIL